MGANVPAMPRLTPFRKSRREIPFCLSFEPFHLQLIDLMYRYPHRS